MPSGAPQKREKKKPKKDAGTKGVRSSADSAPAPAVEIIGKKRKQRDG